MCLLIPALTLTSPSFHTPFLPDLFHSPFNPSFSRAFEFPRPLLPTTLLAPAVTSIYSLLPLTPWDPYYFHPWIPSTNPFISPLSRTHPSPLPFHPLLSSPSLLSPIYSSFTLLTSSSSSFPYPTPLLNPLTIHFVVKLSLSLVTLPLPPARPL